MLPSLLLLFITVLQLLLLPLPVMSSKVAVQPYLDECGLKARTCRTIQSLWAGYGKALEVGTLGMMKMMMMMIMMMMMMMMMMMVVVVVVVLEEGKREHRFPFSMVITADVVIVIFPYT